MRATFLVALRFGSFGHAPCLKVKQKLECTEANFFQPLQGACVVFSIQTSYMPRPQHATSQCQKTV